MIQQLDQGKIPYVVLNILHKIQGAQKTVELPFK